MTHRLSGQLICANAAEAARVRRYLPDHIALSRAQPGCLSFDVTPTADPLIWQVEETFLDRASFEAHQQRSRASVWFAQTASIKRVYQIA